MKRDPTNPTGDPDAGFDSADGEAHSGPLREEDVTAGDRLDDRVAEGEGLPDEDEQG